MSLLSDLESAQRTITDLRSRLDAANGSRSTGEWSHRDVWHRIGKNFRVEIVHAIEKPLPRWARQEGPNRWFVYAYIYPSHPRFARIVGDDIWQDATNDLNMHGGCTFLQWHKDNANVVQSIKVGADYRHAWDEAYTHADSLESSGVGRDAEELFNLLNAEANATTAVMATVGAEPRDEMGAPL